MDIGFPEFHSNLLLINDFYVERKKASGKISGAFSVGTDLGFNLKEIILVKKGVVNAPF
ncbi:hypothetical protein [Paenibacillus sp. BGI2013]|uniref:hypothetical protein n=1 Tax=Paenibacillus sp. BGI2013 TaxID=2058902 RepID=UPI0015D5C5FF|nr:hypothetical protein [Paenibacillus sp. BGI2013]